jgi:hypothetical protein
MSVSRVKYIKQFFPIQAYTFDAANNQLVITSNNHLLYANANINLTSGIQYEAYSAKVVSKTTNTFIVSATANLAYLTNYYVNGYVTGQTGAKEPQTLPRATGTETIIQSYIDGSGGASYSIDVSLDNSHWITLGSITHGSSDGNTAFATISPGWAYMRANLSSVGANTNLVIMTGE